MITADAIAEAARYTDALLEEVGSLEAWAKMHEIDSQGLAYVAMQRALRMAFARDGGDPEALPRDQFVTLQISASSQAEMSYLSACWMDGFAAGLLTERKKNR